MYILSANRVANPRWVPRENGGMHNRTTPVVETCAPLDLIRVFARRVDVARDVSAWAPEKTLRLARQQLLPVAFDFGPDKLIESSQSDSQQSKQEEEIGVQWKVSLSVVVLVFLECPFLMKKDSLSIRRSTIWRWSFMKIEKYCSFFINFKN